MLLQTVAVVISEFVMNTVAYIPVIFLGCAPGAFQGGFYAQFVQKEQILVLRRVRSGEKPAAVKYGIGSGQKCQCLSFGAE